MAGKRNAGNKRPSMFEVAKLAGVSHQTVCVILRNDQILVHILNICTAICNQRHQIITVFIY